MGVNRYRLDQQEPIDVLGIDNSTMRASQIRRLVEVKKERDFSRVPAALAALTRVANTGEGDLLKAATEAARCRATIGEISDAMRQASASHEAFQRLFRAFMAPPMAMIQSSPISYVGSARSRRRLEYQGS